VTDPWAALGPHLTFARERSPANAQNASVDVLERRSVASLSFP
jgi:hypothetical protein